MRAVIPSYNNNEEMRHGNKIKNKNDVFRIIIMMMMKLIMHHHRCLKYYYL